MGHEIIYCSGCKKQLRSNDFERGSAVRETAHAWCAECYPAARRPAKPPISSESPRKGTSSIPIVTGRPKTSRRAKPASGTGAALLVGGLIAAGLLMVLVVAASSDGRRGGEESSDRPRVPAPLAPTAPRVPSQTGKKLSEDAIRPPPGRSRVSKPEEVLGELRDMLAARRNPAEILMRLEQEQQAFRGGPLERELGEIRKQAEALRGKSDPDQDVAKLLNQVGTILDSKDVGSRRSEVEGMLAAARSLGGSRQEEVRKLAERAQEEFKPAEKPPDPQAASLEVVGLSLVDLRTGKLHPGLEKLENGVVIDLNRLDPKCTGIRAQVRGPAGKSVRFDLDGKVGYRIESTEPYDLDGTGTQGPMPWMGKAGRHDLTVVPHPKKDASGRSGKSYTLTFSVVPAR